MPLIRWSRKFELGVYIFDAEHMQLLSHVNDLYEAIIDGISENALYTVLNGIGSFVQRHSAHEEEFFHVSGYRNAPAHIAEHRRLADDLERIRHSRAGPNAVAYDVNAFLLTWFTDHILGLDREFCVHLRNLGIR